MGVTMSKLDEKAAAIFSAHYEMSPAPGGSLPSADEPGDNQLVVTSQSIPLLQSACSDTAGRLVRSISETISIRLPRT